MAKKCKYQEWLEPDNLIKLQLWARNGLTDNEIAAKMGIARSTLSEWKAKYKEIGDTLKESKEIVDAMVENSLLKRALGYKYKEVTRENTYNELTGRYEMTATKEVIKEAQPDTTAQIFWLKNRKPKEWRDKPLDVVREERQEQAKEMLVAIRKAVDHEL